MPPLSSTSHVILGMLAQRPRSGYDIKQFVDRSTRHFWAASYGQIYPDLKRLAEAGLVVGKSTPSGGRRRTVFNITEEGRAALHEWLTSPAEPLEEVRDEALLKIFFADLLTLEETTAVLHVKRASHQRTLDQLESQLEEAQSHRAARGLRPMPMALDYGIQFHRWAVAWCDETEALLRSEASQGRSSPRAPDATAAAG
jgi:DNA-binding PadR family transcriptional regulator